MGVKVEEASTIDFEGFLNLLRSKTRAFVEIEGHDYYVTHTDGYWRIQDCEKLNDKNHFSDCSELVSTLSELVEMPWKDGKSLHDLFADAKVYESDQEAWKEQGN